MATEAKVKGNLYIFSSVLCCGCVKLQSGSVSDRRLWHFIEVIYRDFYHLFLYIKVGLHCCEVKKSETIFCYIFSKNNDNSFLLIIFSLNNIKMADDSWRTNAFRQSVVTKM